MQRLQTLDAEFLYLEDAHSPMHIAGLCIFEGPVPTHAELTELCRVLVRAYPRYQQRLSRAPAGLGAPCWVDDPSFDVGYHLRFTALASPHDDRALATLMGRVLSQLLDRERPLWECWVVEGLSGGRWAMISKIHHSLVDGQSGVSLLTAWFDEGARQAPARASKPLHAKAAPSEPLPWRTALRRGTELASGLARLAWGLRSQELKSIQGSIGTHRAYAFGSVSLADVQRVRAAFGGTVNDVVLSLVVGAYRSLMRQRGDDVSAGPLRALVPVSTRAGEVAGMSGNRVAAWFCELPTHVADPVERLRALSSHTRELKLHSHMHEASDWFVHLGDRLPPWLLAGVTRAAGQLMHRFPQRSIATITTNVRGPGGALSCLGRKLVAYYPYVPIMQGARVATAILSYDGTLAFGITSDYDTVPEGHLIIESITAELAQLVARAAAQGSVATGSVVQAPRP